MADGQIGQNGVNVPVMRNAVEEYKEDFDTASMYI